MINTTLCHIEKDGCYLMLHRVKKENDLNKKGRNIEKKENELNSKEKELSKKG